MFIDWKKIKDFRGRLIKGEDTKLIADESYLSWRWRYYIFYAKNGIEEVKFANRCVCVKMWGIFSSNLER